MSESESEDPEKWSDMEDFTLDKIKKKEKRRRVISDEEEEEISSESPGPSKRNDMEVGPVIINKNFVTKVEGDAHNQILKKIRLVEEAQQQIGKLKVEYQKNFKRPFDAARAISKMPNYSTFPSNYTRKLTELPEPDYKKGCRCCGKPSTTLSSYGLCSGCTSCKKSKHDKQRLECEGLYQQPDACPVDYRLFTCGKCRAFKIKQVAPKYYTANNLKSKGRLPSTEPGQFGYVMDLSSASVNASKFDRRSITKDAQSAALLIRAIDLNGKDKDGVSVRHLANDLLRFDLFDAKWQTSFGLEQLMRKITTRFSKIEKVKQNILPSLLQVEMKLIPWAEWDTGMWDKTAAVELASYTLADFVLTPLLNQYQPIQTIFSKLVVEAQYFDVDRFNFFLAKRGGSVSWFRTEETGICFFLPSTNAESAEEVSRMSRKVAGKTVKKQKRARFESEQKTPLATISPLPTQISFGGCIYMALFESGHVYGGKYNNLWPNPHRECYCTFCQFRQKNPKLKYFKTVVYYVEKNEELDAYEGMFHFLLKMADLKKMKLSEMSLPFPFKRENYEKTWPHFDPSASLPEQAIKFVNCEINCQPLNSKQFDDMINIAKVMFKIDLKIAYDYSFDPLNYVKNTK